MFLVWMLVVGGLADDPLTKSFITSSANVRRVRVAIEVRRAVISNGADDLHPSRGSPGVARLETACGLRPIEDRIATRSW